MKLINFISPGKLKLFLAECKKIFAPISHIHKTSDIENLDENLNNKYDKTAVQTQGTVLAAPSDKDGIADFRKLTKEDIGLGDVAQIVHLTKAEYKELEKKGQLNPDIDYATTDESDNITDSSVQLWNTSSSLAQQGKYLSYSNQNGGKYLSLMNSSDNTAVAHAKLMDGESGEGMDVDADKVKTIDSKGILVDALGETTAQALIDEVAKRVIDLTGRMSTTENGLQSANDAITSLNSDLKNTISSNETVINPNIAKSVLTVFNGWDSNAANYNSFFKNKLSILITVWVWNNTIGNLEAERAQCMIHSSKIMYRYYDYNHNWSEWG